MSIGTTLAEARESAGLSLEDVAKATRIRRTLILGIENDDFSACGGDFYARGHLRNIAAAVGLDPAPLLAEFDASRTAGGAAARDRGLRVRDAGPGPSAAGRTGAPRWSPRSCWWSVYGVVQAFTGDDDRGTDRPAGTDTTSSAPASPSASPVGHAVRRRRQRGRPGAARQGHRRRCWPPTAAGSRSPPAPARSCSRGCCSAATQKTFTDKTRLRLVIGNAGGVDLTVNGTEIGAPGRPGPGRPGPVHPRGPRRRLTRLTGRPVLRTAVRLAQCPPPPRRAGASRWSPSAAAATRSTPRSSPAGSPPTAGCWCPRPPTPTSRS